MNIYEIARDCYPLIMVNRTTPWEQEIHNYRADIIAAIDSKYPKLFYGGCSNCVDVFHNKDFDTLEFVFSKNFKKKILKLYPEALV